MKEKYQAEYLKVNGKFELIKVTPIEEDEPNSNFIIREYYDGESVKIPVSEEWEKCFYEDEFKSQKAIEFIREIGELCKVGKDSESEYLIVYLDNVDNKDFRAINRKVAIKVDTTREISGSFLAKGDPINGKYNRISNMFIEE